LAGAVQLSFGPADRYPDVNALAHYRDLAAAFGVGFDPELLDKGNRNTFTTMCLATLAALGELAEPLDLVVLAHAVPDIDVTGFAASALSHRMSGEPPAFAVGDQGVATPFTALGIAAEYLRGDDTKRVLVVLLDQLTVPYRTPLPARQEPDTDAAVGLLLAADPAAGGGLAVHQIADVDPADVPTILPSMLRELTATSAAPVVIAGSGLDAIRDLPDLGVPVVETPPGRPTTGLWCDLQVQPDAWVIAIDYDRTLRYLCAAAIHGAYPKETVT
jgi:4-hydroxymandelate oxidase